MIRLEVIQGREEGRVFELEEDRISIGRAPSNTVVLSDHHLSAEHGLVYREEDRYVYRDLRSTNGSMVLRGSKRIVLDGSDRWEITLQQGDRLLLGDAASPVILLCSMLSMAASTEPPTRIIARRTISGLQSVAGKVEKSPDVSALYAALKAMGGRLDLGETLEAVAGCLREIDLTS